MKSIFLSIAVLMCTAASLFAQYELKISTENGERCYLLINGTQWNQDPQNVIDVKNFLN